jgi:hypothetical protein
METDQQTNAVATATRAAPAGARHVITGIIASYSGGTADAMATVTLGSGVTFDFHVDAAQHSVVIPLRMTGNRGEAVSVSLPAGGIGILGNVVMVGETV